MEYPVLYIDTNNDKKRFWRIWIVKKKNNEFELHREYGIIGGKITILTPIKMDNEKKIKTRADMLFRKKKESGFYESNNNKKDIKRTKQDVIRPMGAHKLDDFYQKLRYPVCVQKKLDGYRCLANFKDNQVHLYTRTMKPYYHLHHIREELMKIKDFFNSSGDMYFDGELYEHGIKLHNIGSIVRREEVSNEEMRSVSYYIFDTFELNHMDRTFSERYSILENIFKKHSFQYLKLVKCVEVNNYEDVLKENEKYLMEGYEGVIVRNLDGLYQFNKKSYDVLRTKEFKKKEFEIIGAKRGEGQQEGAIIWKCKCDKKNHEDYFWAIPIGTIENRRRLYNDFQRNSKSYIGKKAVVKYLDIDKNGCVTRNPIVTNIII